MKTIMTDEDMREAITDFFNLHMIVKSAFARRYCPELKTRLMHLHRDDWKLSKPCKKILKEAFTYMRNELKQHLDREMYFTLIELCCFSKPELCEEMGINRYQLHFLREREQIKFLKDEISWILDDLDKLIEMLEA